MPTPPSGDDTRPARPSAKEFQDSRAWLTLGIINESIQALARQDTLPDFWRVLCERARLVIPTRQMCALKNLDDGLSQVIGKLEGRDYTPFEDVYVSHTQDRLGQVCSSDRPNVILQPSKRLKPVDTWRTWLLKDNPEAILAAPIRHRDAQLGTLVFVLHTFDDASRHMLQTCATTYGLVAGIALAALDAGQAP